MRHFGARRYVGSLLDTQKLYSEIPKHRSWIVGYFGTSRREILTNKVKKWCQCNIGRSFHVKTKKSKLVGLKIVWCHWNLLKYMYLKLSEQTQSTKLHVQEYANQWLCLLHQQNGQTTLRPICVDRPTCILNALEPSWLRSYFCRRAWKDGETAQVSR